MAALNNEDPTSSLLLVDGFNLLHALILKGRDRPEWWSVAHQERVLELVSRYRGHEECWVVFDAARADSARLEAESQVRLHYAPDADAWILEQIKTLRPRQVVVVTNDRSLQDRAKMLGAQRMSPWQFAREPTTTHPIDKNDEATRT